MPGFTYIAVDKQGKQRKGSVEAADKEKALAAIKASGLMPMSVTPETLLTKDLDITLGSPVKVKEMSMFCRQFTSILRAGMPVNEALGMLAEQTENKGFKKAIKELQRSIQKGETLADSMRRIPKYFSPMMINLVEAGEASGSLDVSMERMSIQLEKDDHLQSMIKKAMTYPMIVCAVAVLVIIVMLTYVVPTFMEMFADMDIEMPAITMAVMAASNFMREHLLLVLGIIAALIFGASAFLKSETGKYAVSSLNLKIPALRGFVIKTSCSRMSRTLTTLLYAGIPMVDALGIAANTMTNVIMRDAILEANEEVKKGIPFSAALKRSGLFPAMLVNSIAIGEESGDIKEMTVKMADFYDEETELATQTLLTFLEPMIMMFLAVIVCVVIAAVMSPMLSLYTGLDKLS